MQNRQAVGLNPIPLTTDPYRQSSAALLWVVGYDFGKKIDIFGGDNTITVNK